jgi:hypothetical protein
MRRLMLCLVLLAPVEARQPSVDHLLQAYVHAGWSWEAVRGKGKMMCIGPEESKFVDRVVEMLGHRAKGVTCS